MLYLFTFIFLRTIIDNRFVIIFLESISIIVLLIFLRGKNYIKKYEYRLNSKIFFFSILAGIGGAFFYSFNLLIPMPPISPIYMTYVFGDYIEICFLIPIFEELLFRCYMFRDLTNNYPLQFSIIISSIIFGVLHGNIWQSPITFVHGILLAYMVFITDNIIYAIIIHVTINFWNIGIKGSNFLIQMLYTNFPIELCGILVGFLGMSLIIFSIIKIKKLVLQ